MVWSGFGTITGFESGVCDGTQKLGNSLAFPAAILDRVFWLVDGLSPGMVSPFSVAKKNGVRSF